MRKAVLGGTFDVLHDGHRAMLNTAFQMAGHVRIGITTDQRANEKRDRDVYPIEDRKDALREACESFANIYGSEYEIMEIEKAEDGALTTDADYIVASPEEKVLERIQGINETRQELGFSRLQIVEAPMVTDYKYRKISATRIRTGEIDEHGNQVTA